jgi:DNA-binding NarL/FixJ family response regulator
MEESIEIPATAIMIIDGQEIFCLGLKEFFRRTAPENHVSWFTNVEKAKTELNNKNYQFLLFDILIPDTDVKVFTQFCKANYPNLLLIIVSSVVDVNIMKECLNAGVNGFVSKAVTYAELKLMLETVYKGEKYISTELSNRVTSNFLYAEKRNLTGKELDIIRLIAAGDTVNLIAEKMYLSPYTIMSHRRNIMKKLDLHSAVELVKYAFKNNLI